MNAMNARLKAAAPATVSEAAPTCRVALRLAEPIPAGIALGLTLPDRVGARAVAGTRSALCLGPDEWLLEAHEAEGPALIAALADLGKLMPIGAVEVSDREVTLTLEGPAVLELLATGCPRDLARMPVGAGARTLFDTAQVVLVREAEDRFRLTVWRSFAPHVRALLDLAASELAAGF